MQPRASRRVISDILPTSVVLLLCIVGRNRNERRLLGYIYQSLTVDVEVPNLEAAGSNPAGRANTYMAPPWGALVCIGGSVIMMRTLFDKLRQQFGRT